MRLISKRKVSRIAESILKTGARSALFVNSGSSQDMNISYLSGFFGMLDGALILNADFELTLITTGLDYERAMDEATADEIIKPRRNVTTEDVVKKICKKSGKIGVVKNCLTLKTKEILGIPESRYIDVGKIMYQHRSIKEEKEADAILKCSHICNGGVRFLENFLTKNLMRNEISSELGRELNRLGSERAPFDTIVTSGPDSAYIHPYPSSPVKGLVRGLGLIDFGAVYKGYATDVTVPFKLGKLTRIEEKILKTVLSTYDAIVKILGNGSDTKNISSLFDRKLKSSGFKKKHAIGHGIGLEIHEHPSFTGKNLLKKNMVFAIEPGVYVRGVGGTRLENDIMISGKGCNVLTESKLISI